MTTSCMLSHVWTMGQGFKTEAFSDKERHPSPGTICKKKKAKKKASVSQKHVTIPMVSHGGGSIMLWSWFLSAGTGALVEVEGIMNTSRFWLKTFSHLLESWRWRGISPPMTPSVYPDQDRKYFLLVKVLHRRWPHNLTAGALLQGRVGKCIHVKMCHADGFLPKKGKCCN